MMSSIWTMVAFSSGPAPLTKNIPNRYRRSLQQTGIEACSNCIYANGQECVGRTVTDDNCAACANGQKYWPCDVVSECWCWDTSKPRDPPEDADNAGEGGRGARYRHARDVVHLTRRNVWGIRMHSPQRPMRIALVV